jgi:predicted nucleic acid-binding Zn ribbon protein
MKRSNFQTLSQVIDDFFRKNGMEEKIMEERIKDSWNSVVGPIFAKATQQIKISNGVLIVTMKSAAVKHEIFLHRSIIRTKLNEIVEKQFIRDIIVT